MSEVQVNKEKFDSKVTAFLSLQNEVTGIQVKRPSLKGGGQTVNELEVLADLFEDLQLEVANLVSKTDAFMKNMSREYRRLDEQGASYFNK